MRHRIAHRKLGRITPHRTALLRNMATALFERERIRTTLMKAKELRPFAEKLITLAKRDGEGRLHARRLALKDIKDPVVLKKLFDTIGARFASRPGGYTRILRLGFRKGDGAEMAMIELIGSEFDPKKAEKKADGGKGEEKAEKKPAEKKEKKAAKPKAEKADKAEGDKKPRAPRKKKPEASAE